MAPSRQQPAANARQDRSPRTRNGRAVKPTERQQYSTDEAASKQLRRQTRNSEGNQALNNAVKTKGKRSSRLRPTTDDNGRVAELEKQLAEVIAAKGDAVLRSQELQKACDLLKKQVESNKNASMTEGPDGLSGTIPKPKGRAGLQAKMGLSHKRSLYKDIISTIHECTWAAQIDHSMTWKDLDPLVKGQICKAAREQQPYLAQFASNWAAESLLHQFFTNRRQYRNNGRRNGNKKVSLRGGCSDDSSRSSDEEDKSDNDTDDDDEEEMGGVWGGIGEYGTVETVFGGDKDDSDDEEEEDEEKEEGEDEDEDEGEECHIQKRQRVE